MRLSKSRMGLECDCLITSRDNAARPLQVWEQVTSVAVGYVDNAGALKISTRSRKKPTTSIRIIVGDRDCCHGRACMKVKGEIAWLFFG